MTAFVSQRGCAQKSIHDGMDQHIAIGVARQPRLERYGYPTKDEFPPEFRAEADRALEESTRS